VTERSRSAVAGADWQTTYERLCDLDPVTLSATDLDTLAEAAFWLGKPRDSLDARRHAYTAHKQAGDHDQAARAAWLLFIGHFDLSEMAVAGGWVKRGQQHAAATPDSAGAGYVALADADWVRYQGELRDAMARADRAIELGRRHNDPDLVALGQATKGRILVDGGKITDGVGELDEAMVAAVGDELSRFVTGRVYCLLVSTCHELGDVRRAGEWTATAVSWCEKLGEDSWYPGLCRLHRCELESLRGEWMLAEQEALRAAKELVPFGDYWVGEGMYLVGEIRRHKGDLANSEEAYEEAHQLGRDPLPGLALLRAERGDVEGAAKALRLGLAPGGGTPLRRARLLAAHVAVELEAGDVEAADRSSQELNTLADASGVMLLKAMAAKARGAVLLARDQVEDALAALRVACNILRDLSCPYEDAHARLLIGMATRKAGDDQTAQLEFAAAVTIFEELGATLDAERAKALLNRKRPLPRGLTEREIEVLALVAKGQTNRDIAGSLYISEHTVARHLSNVFRKLDVTSRSAAVAFALEHDLA
jgi:DNA-binding NarL/FixJ family response regulator